MLILLRHGQSLWNLDPAKPNQFKYAGSVDVSLSQKGIEQAMDVGKSLRSMPIDVVYCSMLIRAQMTCLIALATHKDGKAPLLVRDSNEEDKRGLRAHTRHMSEGSHQTVLPVYCTHNFDERNFGKLQGMFSWEQKRLYSQEELRSFRKEWDLPFPGGESEAQVYDRCAKFFEKHIRAQLDAGKNVMIICHGFVVRALLAHVFNLTPQQYRDEMELDLAHDPNSLLHAENAVPRVFDYRPKNDGTKFGQDVFVDISGQFPLISERSKKKKSSSSSKPSSKL